MPTPDETAFPPSPPIDIPARSLFASCPPEEDREAHASRDDSDHEGEDTVAAAEAQEIEGHTIAAIAAQEPTPEPEAHAHATESPSESPSQAKEKERAVEHATTGQPAPSPLASPDTAAEGDAHAQASASSDAPASFPPQYLDFEPNKQRLLPNFTSSFLRPGSKFKGTQQSDRQVYDVQVEIKDVDMAESSLCGYLRIQGLTDDHPTLTTFFEGEIIGPKYLFKTTHPSWGSSEKVDLQHWARFPAWRPLAKSAKSPSFTLKNYQQREHIFMRWKEYFLVPDHRVKTITGASFEGFYYICFNQCDGSVSGIYFHAKSEKYQQLDLKHVDDGGCVGAMEFR